MSDLISAVATVDVWLEVLMIMFLLPFSQAVLISLEMSTQNFLSFRDIFVWSNLGLFHVRVLVLHMNK